ncbi:hypothetical protein AURDEDRAFT_173338 [Auricularia subglabra TFB-10046 SS5]|nr:hypothetical protein AURDEDRAFT_173338 [Auricularia subglabra TFB-10046 SS5]
MKLIIYQGSEQPEIDMDVDPLPLSHPSNGETAAAGGTRADYDVDMDDVDVEAMPSDPLPGDLADATGMEGPLFNFAADTPLPYFSEALSQISDLKNQYDAMVSQIREVILGKDPRSDHDHFILYDATETDLSGKIALALGRNSVVLVRNYRGESPLLNWKDLFSFRRPGTTVKPFVQNSALYGDLGRTSLSMTFEEFVNASPDSAQCYSLHERCLYALYRMIAAPAEYMPSSDCMAIGSHDHQFGLKDEHADFLLAKLTMEFLIRKTSGAATSQSAMFEDSESAWDASGPVIPWLQPVRGLMGILLRVTTAVIADTTLDGKTELHLIDRILDEVGQAVSNAIRSSGQTARKGTSGKTKGKRTTG